MIRKGPVSSGLPAPRPFIPSWRKELSALYCQYTPGFIRDGRANSATFPIFDITKIYSYKPGI